MLKYGGRSAPLSVPCRSYCSNPRANCSASGAPADGAKLLKAAERHGLKGIVSKRIDARRAKDD